MAVGAEADLYFFPEAPSPEAVEWPGNPIGVSNTITRTKGRTPRSDKNIDASPELRSRVLQAARRARDYSERHGTLQTHDVVVHGIRIRAFSNSPHLMNFWRDNWYSPEEWSNSTGNPVEKAPRIVVYAFGEVADEPEAAYYSYEQGVIAFFNTSYYGQLKSWVLGAVGRVLASEYGIHSIHGACVDVEGNGVLYIAPTGTGKSTSSYGLMTQPGTRFHSDDWVYVRYTYHTRSGQTIAPTRIRTRAGEEIVGYRCLPWLADPSDRDAEVDGLQLNNKGISVPLSELDLESGPQAYAYISEKVFYLRTNILESFPAPILPILDSKLENVPDVTPAFVEENREALDRIVGAYIPAGGRSDLEPMQAARLIAFDNSRAMLDISKVFGADAVYLNPMQPVLLRDVFLLKRDFSDSTVLEELSEERFLDRLIIGETPTGSREVAYNAYRAVDDPAERSYLDAIEARGGSVSARLMADRQKPASLDEEFTLFRALYLATDCFDLNTTLTQDPDVRDRAEAVDLTIQLIAAVVTGEQRPQRATISDYRQILPL